MRFPYGIADFPTIILEGYFYVDCTDRIRWMEETGRQLLFLRPRRFGKSLWLSTLENYYDLARADDFERLFGGLKVGQNPTPLHNRYFVMRWDFSMVDPGGDYAAIRASLNHHLNIRIKDTVTRYHDWLECPQHTTPSFQHSSEKVTITHPHHPLFGQQVAIVRIRRGADPDLIIRLPDGTHAAVAMSLTDYAGSAGGDPTAIPFPWLDIHGLRQAAQWIAHRRQAGCFPVPTVTPSPPGSNSLPCDHPERSSHERARLGSGFPKPHPPGLDGVNRRAPAPSHPTDRSTGRQTRPHPGDVPPCGDRS